MGTLLHSLLFLCIALLLILECLYAPDKWPSMTEKQQVSIGKLVCLGYHWWASY